MLRSVANPRVRVGTRVALGLTVAAWGVSLLHAQGQGRPEPGSGPSWALDGLRNRQCVRFLIEPATAARHRRDGFRAIRADQDQSLHPALRTVITNQPEFASWIPASLCLFYADTVSLGGRTIAEKNARKAQVIGVWALATAEQGGGARRDLVLDFWAGNGRVVRAAEAIKLRIRDAVSTVGKAPESSDELLDLKIGKTHLVWTGRAVGDSNEVGQPIEEAWLVKGASGTAWNVHAVLKPKWSRPLVGVLRVEGKDDLARALKASPIRFVGPRYLGGSAQLLFSR